MPKITVVMPVFNGERFLHQSIDSILNQTFGDFEFIIIDDGSTDNTLNILKEYASQDQRIRIYNNAQNRGIVKTLNKGLDLATGEYIARQDADDISLPDRFERQLQFLETHPNYGIIGSNYYLIDQNGKRLHINTHPEDDVEIKFELMFETAFCHPSVMLRTSVLRKHQLYYRDDYCHAEDYELWTRLLQVTKGYNLVEPVIEYRHHEKKVGIVYEEKQYYLKEKISKYHFNYYCAHLNVSCCSYQQIKQFVIDGNNANVTKNQVNWSCNFEDILNAFLQKLQINSANERKKHFIPIINRLLYRYKCHQLWKLLIRHHRFTVFLVKNNQSIIIHLYDRYLTGNRRYAITKKI